MTKLLIFIAKLFILIFFLPATFSGQKSTLFFKNGLTYSYIAHRSGTMVEIRYERHLNENNALFLSVGTHFNQILTTRNFGYLRTTPLNHGFRFRYGIQYSVNNIFYTTKKDLAPAYFHEIGIPLEIHFRLDDKFGLIFGFAPTFDLNMFDKNLIEKRPLWPKYFIINNIRLGAYHHF